MKGQSLRVLKAVCVVLVAALLAVPAGSSARTGSGDPSKQREQVRAEKAKLAAQVDALKATDAQVEKALDDLNAHVVGQQAMLAEAQRAADAAMEAFEIAHAAAQAKAAEIKGLQTRVMDLAVESFIHPPSDDVVKALESDTVTQAAKKSSLLALSVDRDADLLDQLSAAHQDLDAQRKLAEEASARAAKKEAEVSGHLGALKDAQAKQQAFETGVQSRLDQALAEAANLEAVDKALSADIARRAAALAARTRAALPSRPAGGGFNPGSGSVKVKNVRGIWVAESIADNTEALLAAAERDGIVLSGGGYRDSSQQVALRRAHCGSSDYDIYQKPSSQCSPPTAPPGTSMHEKGLAIDFTYGGRVISSRSSPAYRWLAANASSYGFYNLPSEPWHWSTNGN
jgi:hypothetical protein